MGGGYNWWVWGLKIRTLLCFGYQGWFLAEGMGMGIVIIVPLKAQHDLSKREHLQEHEWILLFWDHRPMPWDK